MKNINLYLPGFHLQTLRRKPRSAVQVLAAQKEKIRQHSISALGEIFSHFIPNYELENHAVKHFSRRRIFSKENTFWAFFSQVIDADGGCREVIRKIQVLASKRGLPSPSSSSSAYCQARSKLGKNSLQNILTHTGNTLRSSKEQGHLWHQRRVIVVDGTGVSMPDTEANQNQWPQSKSQKDGCGFPSARICACFCLHTGALLSHRIGSRKNHELPLLRDQWETFKPGDIFLGDKGFCSYYDVWQFQGRQVDSVIALARRIPATTTTAKKVLGSDDLLIQWPKPKYTKQLSYNRDTWDEMPDHLTLRQIKVTVKEAGFRVQSYYIVTTLTDAEAYPAAALAELYRERWDVELFFRDIKSTMGMDVLRCHSPDMVEKEILMHLIAYNAVRLLMFKAAENSKSPPKDISFKGSVQALRQWESTLNHAYDSPARIRAIMTHLIENIGSTTKLKRPNRSEPRCVKRRPKPFPLMTLPRAEMREVKLRRKFIAKKA